MVAERIKALREKIQRREKSVRADRQAKQRRVERGEPEGASETAQVKAKQAKEEAEMTADQARELASDAKTHVATELGVSRSEAGGIISEGSDILSSAGERLDDLDLDGDGDTDMLTVVDSPLEDGNGGGSGGGIQGPDLGVDPSEPIFEPSEDDDIF